MQGFGDIFLKKYRTTIEEIKKILIENGANNMQDVD